MLDIERARHLGADPTTLSLGAIWRDRLAADDPETGQDPLIRRKTYSNRVRFRDQLPRQAFGPNLEEQESWQNLQDLRRTALCTSPHSVSRG